MRIINVEKEEEENNYARRIKRKINPAEGDDKINKININHNTHTQEERRKKRGL